MATKRTPKSRNPRLVEAEQAIKANGFKSTNAGLRAVDLDRTTFVKAITRGLAPNPRTNTVKKLRELGVLSIAMRPV